MRSIFTFIQTCENIVPLAPEPERRTGEAN